MLTIYNYEHLVKDKKIILGNDDWFDTEYLIGNYRMDSRIMELMLRIDEAVPVGRGRMDTALGAGVSMECLSTGCKTAINTYVFPDLCFSTCECGNNALVEILRLPGGQICLYERPFSLEDFAVDIQYITDVGSYRCKSYMEFIRIWDRYE